MRKFIRQLSNYKVAFFTDLFTAFVHQFIGQNIRLVIPFLMYIDIVIFKYKIPLPFSSFIHYIVSVHYTQFLINFYWSAVSCLQKSNYCAHFIAYKIFKSNTYFKNISDVQKYSTVFYQMQLDMYWVSPTSNTKMVLLVGWSTTTLKRSTFWTPYIYNIAEQSNIMKLTVWSV